MSKRLQVILEDSEYQEIQRSARSRHMSIAEWVRQALGLAPRARTRKKLVAVRRAAQCEYPTADIDRMLGEIDMTYSDRWRQPQ